MAKQRNKGHENIEPYKWKEGESGNPNGRPKKLVSTINAELKQEGFEPVNAFDVKDAFCTLLNLDIERLGAIATGKSYPMLYRIAAKELLAGKGSEYVEKMLDRAHGKAINTSKVEHELPADTEINLIVKGSKSKLI